eukprot:CAMPEP_0201113634 /NCGR_PEP_ID=MMETSP0812-20130820/77951_1 /ASSEMBLY_ACC=CAM_ASM_000668 /TAXON_ID=98059 /ORGANISM="Dinobryon sp., Strain UTEXLB2267" /LENGTH=158 /DNA_ID=CAMNT_0047377185 /DNA_START=336 /DNA_END=812 /DNA_ORIENTATION=+
MDSWPCAIRAYSAAVSIKERQDVAKASLNIISFIANHRDELVRKELIEIPDLYASVANLCDEELLQQEDYLEMLHERKELIEIPDLYASVANLCDEELLQQEDYLEMLHDIFKIIKSFRIGYVYQQAPTLMETNWIEVLARCFRYAESRQWLLKLLDY